MSHTETRGQGRNTKSKQTTNKKYPKTTTAADWEKNVPSARLAEGPDGYRALGRM